MTTLVTPKQAAARLGIAPSTLRAWAARGLIKATKIDGRTVGYTPAAIKAVKRPKIGPPVKDGRYVGWRQRHEKPDA